MAAASRELKTAREWFEEQWGRGRCEAAAFVHITASQRGGLHRLLPELGQELKELESVVGPLLKAREAALAWLAKREPARVSMASIVVERLNEFAAAGAPLAEAWPVFRGNRDKGQRYANDAARIKVAGVRAWVADVTAEKVTAGRAALAAIALTFDPPVTGTSAFGRREESWRKALLKYVSDAI